MHDDAFMCNDYANRHTYFIYLNKITFICLPNGVQYIHNARTISANIGYNFLKTLLEIIDCLRNDLKIS